MKILEKMKKLLDSKKHESNLLEKITTLHSEGIDQVVEKIFETNHPYERGKQINFE